MSENWYIPSTFPSGAVISAYASLQVDRAFFVVNATSFCSSQVSCIWNISINNSFYSIYWAPWLSCKCNRQAHAVVVGLGTFVGLLMTDPHVPHTLYTCLTYKGRELKRIVILRLIAYGLHSLLALSTPILYVSIFFFCLL